MISSVGGFEGLRGSGLGMEPSGVQGQNPGGGLGQSSQKLMIKQAKERHLQCHIVTMFYVRRTLIKYRQNKQK